VFAISLSNSGKSESLIAIAGFLLAGLRIERFVDSTVFVEVVSRVGSGLHGRDRELPRRESDLEK
jgi:hypothetical protein